VTITARIIALLDTSRVPYDAEEIHYALRDQVSHLTMALVLDTLRLLASRGEVKETAQGWERIVTPKAIGPKQGSLFG
jgi:Fe2+ or Zn2+ uptake regulation protein